MAPSKIDDVQQQSLSWSLSLHLRLTGLAFLAIHVYAFYRSYLALKSNKKDTMKPWIAFWGFRYTILQMLYSFLDLIFISRISYQWLRLILLVLLMHFAILLSQELEKQTKTPWFKKLYKWLKKEAEQEMNELRGGFGRTFKRIILFLDKKFGLRGKLEGELEQLGSLLLEFIQTAGPNMWHYSGDMMGLVASQAYFVSPALYSLLNLTMSLRAVMGMMGLEHMMIEGLPSWITNTKTDMANDNGYAAWYVAGKIKGYTKRLQRGDIPQMISEDSKAKDSTKKLKDGIGNIAKSILGNQDSINGISKAILGQKNSIGSISESILGDKGAIGRISDQIIGGKASMKSISTAVLGS